MTLPYVKEICPTCRVEFIGPHVANPPKKSKGKRCPAGHWHSLNALWHMREKLDREQHPMTKPAKKATPPTLRSLGFGGPQEAYQLAATYLLEGYDQAVKTTPEGTTPTGKTPEGRKQTVCLERYVQQVERKVWPTPTVAMAKGSSGGGGFDAQDRQEPGERQTGLRGGGRRQEWPAEPDVGRVAHGLASRVDRITALGNGQVPRVVAAAWRHLAPNV